MTITKQDLIDLGCDEKDVEAWMAYREYKGKPELPSEVALKAMVTRGNSIKLTLPQTVKLCAENEWIGFKAHYVPKPQIAVVGANIEPKTDRERVRDGMRNITDTSW